MLRFFRYRVRTLLALMTLVGIVLVVLDWWSPDRIELMNRVPISGPITSGSPVALDPPSDDEVMRALQKALPPDDRARHLLMGSHRKPTRIVKEKTADLVDPPRVYPLIGSAQQHHAHYRCTVYIGSDKWCYQYMRKVDHNHLHMVSPTIAATP